MIDLREFAGVAGIVLGVAYAATRLLPFEGLPVTLSSAIEEAAAAPMQKQAQMQKVLVVTGEARARPVFTAVRVKKPEEALPPGTVAEAPLPPEKPVFDPAAASLQAAAVSRHLAAKIPAHLVPYFDTIFYVSKAGSGGWAQNLFIFSKSADGTLVFEESFPISTGRERSEKYFTTTPTGIFTLDPDRMYRMARSNTWNNAAMPYAMFLNYDYRTRKTGIALHSAVGRKALNNLGSRASGGCVRLPPEKAAQLFERVKNGPRSMVPVFSFDSARGTTNIEGRVQKDAAGRTIMRQGVPVLLIIDNMTGPVMVLASL